MIYDKVNIQVAELCSLQFTEPLEASFYDRQYYYIPKLGNSTYFVQILISAELYASTFDLFLKSYDIDGNVLKSYDFVKYELSTGFYYASAYIQDIADYDVGTIANFKIVDSEDTVFADSLYYCIYPEYTSDLKKIQASSLDNNWNYIFVDTENEITSSFKVWVECGAIPKDSRDEQETEDFLEQDMVNDTVYGDEYEVVPFTFGDSMGLPNWLRKKISRATLCDTLEIDSIEYKRTQGAKMEKIEDTENGLATYKMDLQTPNNYLQ